MASVLYSILRWILIIVMLIGLPLAGVVLNGQSIQTYLEFPPLTRYVVHAPFNWSIFAFIAAVDSLLLIGTVALFKPKRGTGEAKKAEKRYTFPTWGWLGGGIMIIGWFLAWTRISWFALFQHHTFCLPWLGYILLVNAWCHQRSGTSLLQETPGRLLLLFPASTVFWWYFEFLNRMVQNWYYTGVENFSAVTYTLFASLAFSTVLPAVLSTLRLLLTLPLFAQRLAATHRLQLPQTTFSAALLLLASGFSLLLLSRFPDHLYPLVWAGPLLVITAMQAIWKKPTIFSPLGRGDWRAIISAAAAALICGFLWELWNVYSLARWEYTIPFVNRFHIFAMPILGYGGYLPFGLECLLVGSIVMGRYKSNICPNI